MFSKLHERLGTAGLVVAVIALIAAIGGTAIAAGGLTAQQEKQVKKIAKKYAGKKGATGPTGPAGAPGLNGTNGAPGAPGADGKDGKDGATGPAGATGPTGKEGAKGATGPTGSAGATGPTGSAGATGATGPSCPEGPCYLPSKSTETGAWGMIIEGTETIYGITFNLPLKEALTISKIKEVNTATVPAECDNGTGEAPSPANPEADPGYLCVFSSLAAENEGTVAAILTPVTGGGGAGKTGALLYVTGTGPAFGTYAVTAP